MRARALVGGYAAAALAGPVIAYVIMGVSEVATGTFRFDFFWAFISVVPFLAILIAIISAPLAIPSIAYAEKSKRCSWLSAVAIGAFLGLLIGFLVNSIPSICEQYDCALPSFWDRMIVFAQLGCLGAASGLAFWSVAWVWMPPNMSEQQTEGETN